jgi:carboxypeptidase family protein/TonB-dependent receptor-like protein
MLLNTFNFLNTHRRGLSKQLTLKLSHLLESGIWHEACLRLGVAQKIQISFEGTAPGRLSPAGVDGRSFFLKLASLVVILELVGSWALAQDKQPTTGAVQGIVFTTDPDGGRSIVPGAKVSLDGPAHFEGKSSTDGKFAITGVAPGAYEVTAKAPGLAAEQEVVVSAGTIKEIRVELKVEAVQESVTVTGNANQVDTKEASGANTVGESTVRNMPNRDERFDSLLPLVPGVVRGPNGRINMKGARASQNGSLVNSADVTDPATGATAISIPIDVVSSIKVLSTPYDPEYGKFTGAVSNVETRPGEFNKFRVSAQNFVPHLRRLDGSIMGIAAATPRITFSAPIIKDRVAVTESVEYRYERDPVNSLPSLQSDTRRESFDSYTQIDMNISQKQTATASFAIFPQKLDYYGLNTFTPQASTPNLHERGYQAYLQHRYFTSSGDLLTSQVSFRKFDADLSPNSNGPYQLSIETTNGGFFNLQNRETSHTEWEEIFRSHARHFHGAHELQAGVEFAHGTYDGRQEFRPVEILGLAGLPLERIQFGPASRSSVDQNEIAWFVGDKWTVSNRLTFDLGLRFDRDSVTDSVNTAPRAGFVLALTKDAKTLLKGGAGLFYDRVPLNIPAFPNLPTRTIAALNSTDGILSSTEYLNVIPNGLQNPRSEVWNLEIDREVIRNLLVRVGYQQRNTVHEFVLTPIAFGSTGILSLSNRGHDFYREVQVTGRYQIGHSTLNASYVHSQAFGDLNDFNQFFGNDPQAVIQPNQRGRLGFDAPNRVIAWGEIAAPWKLTVAPVLDIHTGFPYSTINQFRDFVGPRNQLRFPRFVSTDLQVLREIRLPIKDKHARVGFGVYNVFNRFNPRDVQSDLDSFRSGDFFNGLGRTFHGKFILEL